MRLPEFLFIMAVTGFCFGAGTWLWARFVDHESPKFWRLVLVMTCVVTAVGLFGIAMNALL